MWYTYTVESGRIEIKTPGIKDVSQIKKFNVMNAGAQISRYEYPNGLILETYQTASGVIIRSNRPLHQETDGSLALPES